MEFLRSFLMHVLPSGFQKVRYYGVYSSACKKKLALSRASLPGAIVYAMRTMKAILKKMLGCDVDSCEHCGSKSFVTIPMPSDLNWLIENMSFAPGRSPPGWVQRRLEPELEMI